MLSKPNFLLIAGSGQNCGKTSVSSEIIRKFPQTDIAFIKISPHFHKLQEKTIVLFDSDRFRISREYDLNSKKDTSVLLQAGAAEVFYIQSEDIFLMDALKQIELYTDVNKLFVIESGALAFKIKTGLFIFMQKHPIPKSKIRLQELADVHTEFRDISFILSQIDIQSNHWIYRY